MTWLRILSVAGLLGSAVAEVNLTLIAEVSPVCSQTCTLAGLESTGCGLLDIQSCLCPNMTLLSSVSICTQSNCNVTEQMSASNVLQNYICEGVSQPSRSEEIIRATTITTVFMYLIFTLRCISRYMVAHHIWWDDWCLILAVACTIPMTTIPIYNATKGFGKHFWDVPPQNLSLLQLLYFCSQLLYAFVQPITKISILLLYYRIFPNKYFRLTIKISLAWMTCHLIAFIVVIALQCIPIQAMWDFDVEGKCISLTASLYLGAALSIFEDLVMIILPAFVLRDLNLTSRKKVALGLVFALGSFACITSMVRLKYVVAFSQSADLTWDNVDTIIWSIVETYVAIICASLISIRPLVAKMFPRLFPTTRATDKAKTHTTSSTPAWASKVGSRMSARLRSGNGTVLISDDEMDECNRVVDLPVVKEEEIELRDRAMKFGNSFLAPGTAA